MDPLQGKKAAPPQQGQERAGLREIARQYWQRLITRLTEAKRYLGRPLSPPKFTRKPVRNYQISKTEGATPVLRTLKLPLDSALDDLQKAVGVKLRGKANILKCRDIAKAFLVMDGLATYEKPQFFPRKDFSVRPSTQAVTSTAVEKIKRNVQQMQPEQLLSFYQNDAVVIPRKMGVLQGVGRIIKGSVKRKLTQRAHSKETIQMAAEASLRRLQNPEAVYIVVFGDKPGVLGHSALFIGEKKGDEGSFKYISHLGLADSTAGYLKLLFPGIKTQECVGEYYNDCARYGAPEFIIELKGLDRERMNSHLDKTEDKGYDLMTRNCSTRIGEMLLEGASHTTREKLRQPNGFWTPYDITGLARELWVAENIPAL